MTATAAGLAIFVKTPGHSSLKTRLAQAIGRDAAEAFHRHAAAAVADVVIRAQASMPGLVAYWAVAETDAVDAPIWRHLPRIAQGDGDLGARMRSVCGTLRARHGRALLIGADAPQLRAGDVLAACTALDTHEHVIGPSEDGGFWLFGTRIAVPEHAWSETPWSQSDTALRFLDALGDSSVATLRRLCDVDTVDDLAALADALHALHAPTPKQAALARWLRDLRFPA
ncbi:MAG: DUF2064 domain-containing protein [Lysobacter sp.]|nr:DUF2064 domain-containing protein [Lysobacter sp.]